ncbi:MAG: methyltransferase [Patescibacteria group bacterium]
MIYDSSLIIKVVLILGLLSIFCFRFNNRVIRKIKSRDISNFSFLIFEFAVLLLASVQLFGFEAKLTFSTYFGVIFYFSGLLISNIAIVQLRDNYLPAFIMDVPKNIQTHELYKIIRNPIYLGRIMCFIGFEIVVAFQVAFMSFFIIPFYVFLVFREEKLLRKAFSSKWNFYCAKTRFRLLPYVW